MAVAHPAKVPGMAASASNKSLEDSKLVSKKKTSVNFEKALEEFENLVVRLEEGELSLEDSLKCYERGITLSRSCQSALEEAEQRIQMLDERTGELEDHDPYPDDH